MRTLLGIYWVYLLDLFFRLKSSAAVAYALRSLTYCVLINTLLHITVVMCGYLRYGHLPVSFNQSGPSPLTSLINAFLPTELLLTGWFYVFHTIQPRETVVCEIPRRSAVSEILTPRCLAQSFHEQSPARFSSVIPLFFFSKLNLWQVCQRMQIHYTHVNTLHKSQVTKYRAYRPLKLHTWNVSVLSDI